MSRPDYGSTYQGQTSRVPPLFLAASDWTNLINNIVLSKKTASTPISSSTSESEFIAPHTDRERHLDLCTTLPFLGAPSEGPGLLHSKATCLVNESDFKVAISEKYSKLLQCFQGCATIALEIIKFHFDQGKMDSADILSKHIWKLIKPILFWQGNTMKILEKQNSPSNGE